MSGPARLLLAASAVVLRGLAWPPFSIADRLIAAARWCERHARLPPSTTIPPAP